MAPSFDKFGLRQATKPGERVREILRWGLVLAFGAVGVIHLESPDGFGPIMPDWVPYPREVILATGVCEIAGAMALSTRRFRYLAGVMLAAYAVCVYPANIKHALQHVAIGGIQLSWWYHGPRLAFQPVIIWAALFAGTVIDWPMRRRASGR